MNPRSAKVAVALGGTVVLAGCVAAWLAGSASVIVETAGPVPFQSYAAASLSADTERADLMQAAATDDAAAANIDVATIAEPETKTEMAVADAPVLDEPTAIASLDEPTTIASLDEPTTITALNEPLLVQVAFADSSHIPSPDLPAQAAAANSSGPAPEEVRQAASSLELVLDECLVAEVCIDRYLWALYQRTPKEDTIKVHDRRKVSVKRKGKLVTVTRTFTRLVDQDFTWKDPKAAERVGMPMMDYVIGGMDRSFKTKLFHALRAAEQAGLSPGITSAFRDDYRQSIASGMKAATDRSYHGGSFRGGYGHGLAADVVSVDGATRNQRWASTEKFWKWIDAHGKEFGIGRPYLGRDPPHVGPIDGREYAAHNSGMKAHAQAAVKKPTRLAARDNATKIPAKRKIVQGAARQAKQGKVADRPRLAMAEPRRG